MLTPYGDNGVGFIEWKEMPRGSYRYETDLASADCWPYMTTHKMWKWTVFNNTTRHYEDEGLCSTLDEACEKALKVIDTIRIKAA